MEEKNKEKMLAPELKTGGEVLEKKDSLENESLGTSDTDITAREELEEKIGDERKSINDQIQSHADRIADLPETEKVQNLLELAQKKGVGLAVKTAEKMNNPFILDELHDQLKANPDKYKN